MGLVQLCADFAAIRGGILDFSLLDLGRRISKCFESCFIALLYQFLEVVKAGIVCLWKWIGFDELELSVWVG